jgi:predicted dehydrogenase
MAGIAHDLLDQGYPFLMEKPMGINAPEVEAVAAKAARLDAFVAVPLAQRYTPFATRARELLAVGRFGPLSHIYVRINRPGPARYRTWDCAWMLDPTEAGGGCLRNLGPHGLDMFLHLTGEEAQVTGAQLSRRAHERPVEDYASVMLRSASGILGTIEVGNGFPRDGTRSSPPARATSPSQTPTSPRRLSPHCAMRSTIGGEARRLRPKSQ